MSDLSPLSAAQQAPFKVHEEFDPAQRCVTLYSNIYGRHFVSLVVMYNTERKRQYVWGHIVDERYRSGDGITTAIQLTGEKAVSFRVFDPIVPKRYSASHLREFATTCERALRDVLREWGVNEHEMTHDFAVTLLDRVERRLQQVLA